VNDQISRVLYPIFKLGKIQKKPGKVYSVNLDGTATTIDPNFKMYITSVNKTPDFGPELSLLANFINFGVTQEAFET